MTKGDTVGRSSPRARMWKTENGVQNENVGLEIESWLRRKNNGERNRILQCTCTKSAGGKLRDRERKKERKGKQ